MGETDAVLLRRSGRDPDAFVEVCRRHSDALAGWLGATVRDDALARELLAETLSEAWFSRGRFRDPGDGDARGWLFGIARNLVRRVHRDRAIESRARRRLGLPVADEDVAAQIVERLSARQRVASLGPIPEVLELRIVDDLAYREIADRLDLTPEGARTRVFRALENLRRSAT
jgi:RNA polymerase sigma-70 factor (ECF subfamily)